MEIVYDPVTCKEQGVNNFARLADEMAGIIQRDECRLGIWHLWDWHWLYLSDQQTLGHKRAVAVTNPYPQSGRDSAITHKLLDWVAGPTIRIQQNDCRYISFG